MKKLTTAIGLIVLIYFSACKKSPLTQSPNKLPGLDLSHVTAVLRDSLPALTFDSLDFSRTVIATTDTGKSYFIRVPLKGIPVTERFMLIGTDASLVPQMACQLEIHRVVDPTDSFTFNGTIRKSWLNGTAVYKSSISNGYVLATHSKEMDVMEADDPYVELPEIIIYAPDEDYYANWDLLFTGGGVGYSGGYSSSAPIGGGGGSAAPAVNSASFDVATELQANRPGINLKPILIAFLQSTKLEQATLQPYVSVSLTLEIPIRCGTP